MSVSKLMRIGINLLWMLPGVVGGTETYVRGLISALAQSDHESEYVLFTNRENHRLFAHVGANFRAELCDFSAMSRWRRLAWEQVVLPRRAARLRLDLIHAPAYTSPVLTRCPRVVTIHDCNAWAVPESVHGTRRLVLKLLMRASSRTASAIIAVSEFSARHIVWHLKANPRKVAVIYEASRRRALASPGDWGAFARRWNLFGEYLLAFSSAAPHKNMVGLIRAFGRMRERSGLRLVLVGHPPETTESPMKVAQAEGVGGDVIMTGYLDDGELQLVLEHSHALVFPSLYEGFGIPVLEAMAAGIPVACSNRGALPEIAGEAALFFDPSSPEEIESALQKVVRDKNLRERLIAAGYVNARKYSWERTAAETLRAYRWVYAGANAAMPADEGDTISGYIKMESGDRNLYRGVNDQKRRD